MKKNALVFSSVVWMLVAGFGFETNAVAEDGFKCLIHIYKQVSAQGENYGIKIKAQGKLLSEADSLSIKVPYHKRSIAENWLGFNQALFSADNMKLDQFNRHFPEGEYVITVFPGRYRRYSIELYHDFPDLKVLYPEDGAINVPKKPTIQWNQLTNVNVLDLRVETGWGSYSVGLDPETTSYKPYWTLDPNAQYTLYLDATAIDLLGNKTVTTQKVCFTTGE